MNVKLVPKSISNYTHSFAVYELNFMKCSEILYSEFIDIICNITLC